MIIDIHTVVELNVELKKREHLYITVSYLVQN